MFIKANAFAAQQKCSSGIYDKSLRRLTVKDWNGILTVKDKVESLAGGTE